MSQATTEADTGTGEDESATNTLDELLNRRLSAGDLAVTLHSDHWFYVLNRSDAPAGRFEVSPSGTLAEWVECDPDDDVLFAVNYRQIDRTPGNFTGAADVREAIAHGRIIPRAVPASWLVPAQVEYRDARDRGEWAGVIDFYNEVSP